jgi:hypothetical protein
VSADRRHFSNKREGKSWQGSLRLSPESRYGTQIPRANHALIILIAFTPGLIRIPGSVYQNKL